MDFVPNKEYKCFYSPGQTCQGWILVPMHHRLLIHLFFTTMTFFIIFRITYRMSYFTQSFCSPERYSPRWLMFLKYQKMLPDNQVFITPLNNNPKHNIFCSSSPSPTVSTQSAIPLTYQEAYILLRQHFFTPSSPQTTCSSLLPIL